MVKNYTLEDVETLRSKAGVSYEEAVSLLDKYDGDVTRALIELEKRGQLDANAQSGKFSLEEACAWIRDWWVKGMKTHLCVERKEKQLACLPVLVLILMLILGPYSMIAAALLVLLSGCSVFLEKDGVKKQILKGERKSQEEAAPEAEAAAEEETAPEDEKDQDDDDFPSITIS